VGQDPIFSTQFWGDRLFLNPAYAGVDNSLSVSALTRQQWTALNGRYQTNLLSVDAPFNYAKNSNVGLGFRFVDHRAGDAGYGRFEMSPILSAHLGGRNFTFGAGIQYGIGQVQIDWSRLIFSDQINTFSNEINPSSVINIGNDVSDLIHDLSAGLLFRYLIDDRNETKGLFSLGMSVFHINRARETLIGIDRRMHPRVTIHAQSHFPISHYKTPPDRKVFMSVGYVYNFQSVLTTNTLHVRRNFGEYLFMGLAWRSEQYVFFDNRRESIILTTLINITDDLRITYGYDFVFSQLGAQNTAGSHEIGLVIRFSEVQIGSNLKKKRLGRSSAQDCWYHMNERPTRIPKRIQNMIVY
jgi:type IX secretion system PorP/SprF family membrane protein